MSDSIGRETPAAMPSAAPASGMGAEGEASIAASCQPAIAASVSLRKHGRLSILSGGISLASAQLDKAPPGHFKLICLTQGRVLQTSKGGRREVLSAPVCVLDTSPLPRSHFSSIPNQPPATIIAVSLDRATFATTLALLQQGSELGETMVQFTPAISRVVADLLERPVEPGLTQIYLEGKVDELVCLVLSEAVQFHNVRSLSVQKVRPRDLIRTQEARAILLREQGEPPRLDHLARRVGMNRSKLAACFKEVYGQGVYTYFRSHRLERARQLLLETELSVSQVSDAVGYESVSSFSNSFRARFGLPPGASRGPRGSQIQVSARSSPEVEMGPSPGR